MKPALALALAVALTLIIGAGFAVYDTMKSPRRGSAQN